MITRRIGRPTTLWPDARSHALLYRLRFQCGTRNAASAHRETRATRQDTDATRAVSSIFTALVYSLHFFWKKRPSCFFSLCANLLNIWYPHQEDDATDFVSCSETLTLVGGCKQLRLARNSSADRKHLHAASWRPANCPKTLLPAPAAGFSMDARWI
jgi:hypothetical protein